MPTKRSTDELEQVRAAIATLRDELRVRAHLFTMDVRDEWQALERDAEHAARKTKRLTTETMHELAARLRAFAQRIEQASSARPPTVH